MAKTAVSWRLGAVAALVAGCAWCAHAALEESVWADVSFYSTFDNPDLGIAAERGAGAWNTENGYDGTTPVLPAFITVSGSTPALDLATYQNWTGTKVEGGVSPTQTVLGVEAETFTIAFRASAGGVPNALLFSFGSKSTGGLSFRRAEDGYALALCTGANEARLVGAADSDPAQPWHTYALTYAASTLTFYRDGALVGTVEGVEPSVLIPNGNFQWGKRHGGLITNPAEVAGADALDTLGVWTRVLSEEGILALGREWETFAALTDALWEQVSFYSTFEGKTQGIEPERGEGAWNTTVGNTTPTFVSVSGTNGHALDVSENGYSQWTSDAGQSVLSESDEAFTIVFRGMTGATKGGILFAFGSSGGTEGTGEFGLSFYRGETAGSLVAATGKYESKLTYAPEVGDDAAYHVFALTYDKASETPLALYVDDFATPVATGSVVGALIQPQFQWGRRFGANCADVGEDNGDGALDALGVWKRVLSAEELTTLRDAWGLSAQPVRTRIAFTDVPEGWGTAPSAAQALTASAQIELETMAEARQTVDGRAINTVEVVGAFNAPNVFGISGSGQGNNGTLERDVWLKVSGGKVGTVVGGKENDWKATNNEPDKHANTVNGNLLTELAGTAIADHVVGGLTGLSRGGEAGVGLPFNGDSLVTIAEGARVRGNIVGGDVNYHGRAFTHTGNATVRVYAMQDQTDKSLSLNGRLAGCHIIGGQASADATNRTDGFAVTLTGDSTVEVVLPDDASGTFAKEIIGGSYNTNADGNDYDFTVGGNASVLIDAPEAVTFPNRIVAGGRGWDATVKGLTALTLRGGTFTCELLPAYDGAIAEGGSELILEGDAARGLDITGATLGAFDVVRLRRDIDLGGHRLLGSTLVVEGACTLTLDSTPEERDAQRILIARADAVPEGLTMNVSGVMGWELRCENGYLTYVSPGVKTSTWQTPEDGSTNWADGLKNYYANQDVLFGANEAEQTVTLTGATTPGMVTVAGAYRFEGEGPLTVAGLTVAEGGALTVTEATAPQGLLTVDGTLTYALAGDVALSHAILGSGTLVKTGAGTLSLEDGIAVSPAIEVREGTLTLPTSAYGGYADLPALTATGTGVIDFSGWTGGVKDADTPILLSEGGTLIVRHGNKDWGKDFNPPILIANDGTRGATIRAGNKGSHLDLRGAISGHGLLTFTSNGDGTCGYDLWGALSDDDSGTPLTVRYAPEADDSGTPTLYVIADATHTGGATIAGTGVVTTCRDDALGLGPVTIEEGATLTVQENDESSSTLNVHAAYANRGGTVTGAIRLCEGATLKGDGTAVFDAVSVAEGTTIPLTDLPEVGREPVRVVAWASGPATAEAFVVELPEGAMLLAQDDGLYVCMPQAQIWETPAEGSAWADGLPGFLSGDDVTFPANAAQEPVTLPGANAYPDALVVSGDYAFTGGTVVPTALHVTETGTLTTPFGAIRWPATSVIDGTLAVAVDSNTTLPSFTGSGTLVKTGAGTIRLDRGVTLPANLHLKEGSLAFVGKNGDQDVTYDPIPDIIAEGGTVVDVSGAFCRIPDEDATITLRDNAIFRFTNGNSYSWGNRDLMPRLLVENDGTVEKAARIQGSHNGNATDLKGAISGHGLLIFDAGETNSYDLRAPISDDGGALKVRYADTNSTIYVFNASTYTGGTEVASVVRVYDSETFGSGPVSIEAGGNLTIDSATLNIRAAYANSGTVSGAIQLCEGATLTAGTARFDALTVAEGAVIPVAVGEGFAVEEGACLVSWASADVEATDFAADLPAGFAAEVREDGLYAVSAFSLPTAVAGEPDGVVFDDNAVATLTAAAQGAGLSAVTSVTGLANGQAMTTAQINEALACLTGEGLVLADAEAGTLTVAYDLAVTAITVGDADLAVTATLSGPNGAVRFVEGAKVTLVPVTLGADAAEGEPLAETEAAASDTVTLTGAATPGTVLFKVRVAAP